MYNRNEKAKPLVSALIPTYNSGQFLDACLRSVQDQSYDNIEIIIVDKNSDDNTLEIAQKYTEKIFSGGPERSAQRNHAAREASGEYYFVIDSDMVLDENVIMDLVKVAQNEDFLMGVVPETSFGEGYWAQCKALERSFYVGVPWMEAARFFPRSIFEEFGGYDERGTGAEDYDLPQRIEKKYANKKAYNVTSYIHHNEQNLTLWKTCKKRFYYGQNILNYKDENANQEKYSKQSSLLLRYRLFFRNPKKLFRKPLIGFGVIIMKLCEFISGGIGFLYAKIIQKKI